MGTCLIRVTVETISATTVCPPIQHRVMVQTIAPPELKRSYRFRWESVFAFSSFDFSVRGRIVGLRPVKDDVDPVAGDQPGPLI